VILPIAGARRHRRSIGLRTASRRSAVRQWQRHRRGRRL